MNNYPVAIVVDTKQVSRTLAILVRAESKHEAHGIAAIVAENYMKKVRGNTFHVNVGRVDMVINSNSVRQMG